MKISEIKDLSIDAGIIRLILNIPAGTSVAEYEYDLAHFLFVDAWDYFNKKGWYIEMYTRIIRVSIDDIHWHTIVITDYPSRLYAMAAACKYMWEQEKKNEQ